MASLAVSKKLDNRGIRKYIASLTIEDLSGCRYILDFGVAAGRCGGYHNSGAKPC